MGRFEVSAVRQIVVLALVSVALVAGESRALADGSIDDPGAQESARRAPAEGPQTQGRFPVRLRLLVKKAHSIAVDRLSEHPACRSLFSELGADGLDVLTNVSYVVGSSSVARRVCGSGGVAAYTAIGAAEISLCSPTFASLDRHQAAALLLHEALHSAGLSEQPHDPAALSSRQINDLVESRCEL